MLTEFVRAGCCFALAALSATASATTITVNTDGDPVSANNCPATCSLRHAITSASVIGGDKIIFAPGLASPILLSAQLGDLQIDRPLTIQGPGADALTVSANNVSRVFDIYASATISGLTIANGSVIGANGSNGADGNDSAVDGHPGVSGESVGGACVLVDSGATVLLDHVAIRHCQATGGNGGDGGTGGYGGYGGPGGGGGGAIGAAILSNGSLILRDTSVVDARVTGGNAGSGGAGGQAQIGNGNMPGGQGGTGGQALGGAVAAGAGGSIEIINSTIAQSSATSGAGGWGGIGGLGTLSTPGDGGTAGGGLLYVSSNATLADLEFSTLAEGSVHGGAGGTGFPPGQPGFLTGNAIDAAWTLDVASSIVVGAQDGVDLCYGFVTAVTGSHNASEKTSNTFNGSTCNNFNVNATLATSLKPLDASATPAYMPIWKSPAIDAAATCNDLLSQPVTIDQHDTSRPQPVGGACDLGAIEADYIFVDGFGN